MKVVGIGFHKTGTTTLGIALKTLGYNVVGAKPDLAKHLFENDFESIFRIADSFDAFQDNPWAILYKELDARYPDSKFILTWRDENEWIKSVVNHFGKKHTEMRRWIYGTGHPKGNEQLYLNRYKKHINEVLEYFQNRKEDLLIVSWEKAKGWEELCEFLNKPIPKIPFPHVNKGKFFNHTNQRKK